MCTSYNRKSNTMQINFSIHWTDDMPSDSKMISST